MEKCWNCGAEIIHGARFCTNCGVRLNEVCEEKLKGVGSNDEAPKESVNAVQVRVLAEDLLGVVKGVLTGPVSVTERSVTGLRKETAFLLAGILGILQGLFGTRLIHIVADSFMGIFGGVAGYLGFSYGKIFFGGFIIALISMVVLFAVIYAVGRALGGECKWLEVWNAVVVSAVPYTLGVVCLFLLLYVSRLLGMAAYLFGCIISIICVYSGTKSALGISDDKAVYITSVAYLIMGGAVIFLLKAVLLAIYF